MEIEMIVGPAFRVIFIMLTVTDLVKQSKNSHKFLVAIPVRNLWWKRFFFVKIDWGLI